MDAKRAFLVGVAFIAAVAVAVFLLRQGSHPLSSHQTFTLLDENLNVLGTAPYPPEELEGRVLLGKTEDGQYVYAPPDTVYIPRFVDRLALLKGEEVNVDVPVEWHMEKKGVKIFPLGNRASSSFVLVVTTPYEIIESTVPVVGLYTGKWYLGKVVEANGACILIERWEDENIPVLLEGEAVVDPEARTVCKAECNNPAVICIEDNGVPLKGYYSLGEGGKYDDFFGEFNGCFSFCGCNSFRAYVDGYRPISGEACQGREVFSAERLGGEAISLDGNYIFIDSLGALTSIGPSRVRVGSYKAFTPFPLRERGRGVPVTKVRGWSGYKTVSEAPLYSFVRTEEGYLYITKEGPIRPDGLLLCSGDSCFRVGEGIPVLCFGKERLLWDGQLHGSHCLEVNA